VAQEAGYTRGALYHQFADKDDLVLAAVHWVDEAWRAEVGPLIDAEATPVGALCAFARGHATFCRRDIARVAVALRVELGGSDHPVAEDLERISETGYERVGRLIRKGRQDGSIPDGPPVRVLARAFVGAVEGAVIALSGTAPHDAAVAERAGRGVLGVRG
jgi:AcrR family transcriptional regulator